MKPFKPPGPEAMLTKSVRQLLTAAGIFHWKVWQGMGSTPGVPDIVGIHNGKFIGIELKAPRGVVSPAQQAFIDGREDFEPERRPNCPECGGDYIYSKGREWVCQDCNRAWLKKTKRRTEPDHGQNCPRCGSGRCVKNGTIRMICKDCGRTFNRI